MGEAAACNPTSSDSPSATEEDLLAQLTYFEARADPQDPEQAAMLDKMREHVRRLRYARGDWNKPSCNRDWNDPTPPSSATAPMAIDSYRAYKKHIGSDQAVPLLRQASL
ncbi:hypothetical protein ACKKBF_B32350 [Auxenochlorella protothecoides x Auxenochlorella symbiontica]